MEQKDIFGLLLLPIIFGLCYVVWQGIRLYEKKKYNSLYYSGNKTQARVSNVSCSLLGNIACIFQVTIDYSFRDESGKEFKGYGKFQNEKFPGSSDEIKKGDLITIYYLPKEPAVNVIEQIVLKKCSALTF